MKTLNIRLRLPRLQTLREQVFTVGGLGALTAAAWTAAGLAAGLAAAGVALLTMEYLTRPEQGGVR